jgi:hypothetical protein
MTAAVSQAGTPNQSVCIELTEDPAALLLSEEQRVLMQSAVHKKADSSSPRALGSGGVTDHNSSSSCGPGSILVTRSR